MGNKLVIVESPSKTKSIEKYLGPGYVVKASFGHIRDMPQRSMGVEAPNYRPTYELTDKGKKTVKTLKALAKDADEVILATDPDREGEAIAWHLKEALGLKDPTRITFNEVTKDAVNAAIQHKRKIDGKTVAAQEARRVLDRLVGYRVSPAISEIAGEPLSAGRVQSPAVRLIVEREEAIEAFTPTDHYGVELYFPEAWSAQWYFKPLLAEDAEQPYWLDKAFAEKVAGLKQVRVSKIEKKRRSRAPKPPFTTSTLQQVGASRLKMKTREVMDAAQKLFEGVGDGGFITYHRTDSCNMSDEGAAKVWAALKDKGFDGYIPDAKNTWKEKGDAQGAHEAIRPSNLAVESVAEHYGENSNEARLYRLIWERAVASQMKPKEEDVTTIELTALEELDGQSMMFRTSGAVPVFDGWTRITSNDKDNEDEDDEDEAGTLPALAEGQELTAERGEVKAKQTQPPNRYTEATLTKALEDNGIGRPSTFASILDTVIYKRAYVVADKKGRLSPSEVARKTLIGSLRGRFAFADLDYTRNIETTLDAIAAGKAKYKDVITAVDQQLDKELAQLERDGLIVVHNCPECGSRMVKRPGKSGHFWACTAYPECKTTLPDVDGKPGAAPEAYTGPTYPCPTCSSDMVPKRSGNNIFWGCTSYPECKTTLPDAEGKPAPAFKCPQCSSLLRQLTARKGKNKGKKFWVCTGTQDKDCKFTADDNKGNPVLE